MNYRVATARPVHRRIRPRGLRLTTEMHVITYIYTGEEVRRNTGRHASSASGFTQPKGQLRCKDGKYVNASLPPLRLTPAQSRRWASGWIATAWPATCRTRNTRTRRRSGRTGCTYTGCSSSSSPASPRTRSTTGGQERGFTWGAIRNPDDLIDDGHLQDRGFWTEVEHPDLGRTLTYPGPAGIYNGSPWRISRRAPLIGEHNEEIMCGELGLSRAELSVLAEGGVV